LIECFYAKPDQFRLRFWTDSIEFAFQGQSLRLDRMAGTGRTLWTTHRVLVQATQPQEVFASVARNLVRFRPKHSSGAFRAWLWTIARNKIIDANRTRNSHPVPAGGSSANLAMQQVLDPIQMDEAEQLSEPNDEQQNNALVQRAMAQVAIDFEPRTWQVFTRTVLDQTATGVVAEEFGISQAAVRQIRSRVLRRIRQQLGDME
jgi:RNA polymerase sigma-70 factor, ECF subfamily